MITPRRSWLILVLATGVSTLGLAPRPVLAMLPAVDAAIRSADALTKQIEMPGDGAAVTKNLDRAVQEGTEAVTQLEKSAAKEQPPDTRRQLGTAAGKLAEAYQRLQSEAQKSGSRADLASNFSPPVLGKIKLIIDNAHKVAADVGAGQEGGTAASSGANNGAAGPGLSTSASGSTLVSGGKSPFDVSLLPPWALPIGVIGVSLLIVVAFLNRGRLKDAAKPVFDRLAAAEKGRAERRRQFHDLKAGSRGLSGAGTVPDPASPRIEPGTQSTGNSQPLVEGDQTPITTREALLEYRKHVRSELYEGLKQMLTPLVERITQLDTTVAALKQTQRELAGSITTSLDARRGEGPRSGSPNVFTTELSEIRSRLKSLEDGLGLQTRTGKSLRAELVQGFSDNQTTMIELMTSLERARPAEPVPKPAVGAPGGYRNLPPGLERLREARRVLEEILLKDGSAGVWAGSLLRQLKGLDRLGAEPLLERRWIDDEKNRKVIQQLLFVPPASSFAPLAAADDDQVRAFYRLQEEVMLFQRQLARELYGRFQVMPILPQPRRDEFDPRQHQTSGQVVSTADATVDNKIQRLLFPGLMIGKEVVSRAVVVCFRHGEAGADGASRTASEEDADGAFAGDGWSQGEVTSAEDGLGSGEVQGAGSKAPVSPPDPQPQSKSARGY